MDADFEDIDGDGDLDLLVASGGYEIDNQLVVFADRIYLNDGKGNFTKSENGLENFSSSSSCIRPADIDGDGDLDLYVGGSVAPGKFPESTQSRILINDGKGIYTDETVSIAPEMPINGIVKDALWINLNGDKLLDLVVVGEWMPITIFENENGKLVDKTSAYFSFNSSGLWQTIHSADFDGDGDEDLMVGNFGENTQLKVEPNRPLQVYAGDYDANGSIDPILVLTSKESPGLFLLKKIY